MGLGLTGKLGRAWVGAWYVHGMAHGLGGCLKGVLYYLSVGVLDEVWWCL